MSKPREFFIADNPSLNVNDIELRMCFNHAQRHKVTGDVIHVIEKSAADKLAEALDNMVSDTLQMDGTCPRATWQDGDKALKEYRGEK